jgi:hypothetical protein
LFVQPPRPRVTARQGSQELSSFCPHLFLVNRADCRSRNFLDISLQALQPFERVSILDFMRFFSSCTFCRPQRHRNASRTNVGTRQRRAAQAHHAQIVRDCRAIRGRESSPQPSARVALMGAGDGVLMWVES